MKKPKKDDERFAWLHQHGEPGLRLKRLLIAMEDFQRAYDAVRIAVVDIEYFRGTEMNEAMRGLTDTQIAILASAAKDLQKWQEEWNQRAARRKALKSMPYSDYLETDEWKATRAGAYRRAGYRCQLCGAQDIELNVHHNSYDRLGEEHSEDLIVLCEACHARFHGKVPKP